MSDMKFVCIYLRRTNGTGEKISVNSLVTTKQLYGFTAQILKMGQTNFDLYLRGQKIIEDGQMTLERLKIEQQSIIHVKQMSQVRDEKLSLRIFCRGSIYSYQTNKNSTISALKQQMIGILGCDFNDIIISHLGKAIVNSSTFQSNKIKNKDLISVLIYPSTLYHRSSIRLKPKMAESLTFAATDQIDSNYQPFAKQVLRKSSMKSSHQSREFKVEQSKKLLQAIRPKSEKGHSQQILDQQNGLLRLPWLNNQKMIQTESINFDDPQVQDGPELWVQCKIELTNKANTLFCIIECYQFCDMNSVIRVLARIQRKSPEEIELIFPDQNLQRMAQAKQKILSIAKYNKTKIIHNVVFN